MEEKTLKLTMLHTEIITTYGFHPENPRRWKLMMAGAQVSQDGGENWSTYMNQPTSQFYRVTTDDHFPFRIYAAQQDNSTIRINHRSSGSSISESDWEVNSRRRICSYCSRPFK